MIEAWRAFLETAGAVIEGGVPARFGDSRRESELAAGGDIVADLSTFGLISVRGDDAASFLQGQVTNDTGEVSDHHSQLSAMCSPKGRMLASFRILKRDAIYYLVLPSNMLESALKRLRLFVLRADARLENASDQLVVIGLQGAGTARKAEEFLGELPEAVDEVVQVRETSLVRLAGAKDRFLAVGPVAAVKTLWTTLTEVATPVAGQAWALTEILSGLPTIHPQTADAFVPQMVNYQAVGGVSFSKGCYTGQEVVARMQYLGKLKRRMYRARVISDSAPAPGDELFAPSCDSGQGAGRVVNAQPHPEGGFELLAVIHIESAEKDTVRLKDAAGPALQLEPLPYSLEA